MYLNLTIKMFRNCFVAVAANFVVKLQDQDLVQATERLIPHILKSSFVSTTCDILCSYSGLLSDLCRFHNLS